MNPSVQLFAKQQGVTGADYSQYLQLDLYQSEPIKLTKSVQGLEDPEKTTSGYSQTFRVPHTSWNGQYFKSVFNVNIEDFDASKKADAYINVDGRYFTSGNIRLTNIFRNGREGKIEYQIIFMGETSNFGSIVGPKDLSDLNMNDYSHNLDYTTVTNSWNGNLFGGDIVYPLAEYGYTYGNNGDPIQPTCSVYNNTTGVGRSIKGFTNPSNAMLPEQLRPAIRVKRVWDRIFEEAGFTYESNFLGAMGATASNFFDNIYMLSTNVSLPTFQLDNSFRTLFVTNELQPVTVPVSGQINIQQIFTDPSNSVSLTNNTYEAPGTGQPYTFTLSNVFTEFNHNSAQNARDNVYLYIDFIKNGIVIDSRPAYSWKSTLGQPSGQGYLANSSGGTYQGLTISYNLIKAEPELRTFTFTANAVVDDVFTFKIRVTANEIQSLKVTNGIFSGSGQPYVTPAGMLPTQYKQIEFIKGINDRFKLVWEPDPNNPKNFYIEPWNDWILGGQQRDWTDKLDESVDVDITPLFQTQQREIFYQDAKEGDLYNVLFENQNKEIFGELKFDSRSEVLKGVKNIKSFFAPTPLAPIPGDNQFLMPHFAKDTETERQPIQVKPRLLFWNGLQSAPSSWYLDNGGTAVLQTTYPLMSQFSLYPFDENSFDLNWNNVQQYWDPDTLGFDGRTNRTAYAQYWQTWSDYVYSAYSRKMVATFVLNAQDVQELRYNDKIYVKDAWWLVQEIKDYVLGAYAKSRVTLIKLADNIGFGLDQAAADQGTLYQITGLCFAGGFTNPTVCTACCCEGLTNVSVWSRQKTLDTSVGLFADNGANIPAQAGYYSDGTYAYEVDSFGTIIQVAICSGCACGPGVLQSATVNSGADLCTVCCDETFPLTIYHNGATGANLDQATLAYPGATGGGILTSGNWYRESGSNSAVQIGRDGNTILQVGTCTACDCSELPIEFDDAKVVNGVGATAERNSCCVEYSASLPTSTMYATDATYGVATGYYYDPYAVSPVSPGTTSLVTGVGNTGEWVQVSDGNAEVFGICATGAAKITECKRTQYVRSVLIPAGGTAECVYDYYLSGQDSEGNQTAEEFVGTVTLSGSSLQSQYDDLYSEPSYMTVEWEVPAIYGGSVTVRVWDNDGNTDPIYNTGPGQPLTGRTPAFGPFNDSPNGGALGTTWTVAVNWVP